MVNDGDWVGWPQFAVFEKSSMNLPVVQEMVQRYSKFDSIYVLLANQLGDSRREERKKEKEREREGEKKVRRKKQQLKNFNQDRDFAGEQM